MTAFTQSLGALWQRWKRRWIAVDVPDDIALCEFDCRRGQCHYDKWASCERRLSKAAGELMPLNVKHGAAKEDFRA